jgi:hypothetical protein
VARRDADNPGYLFDNSQRAPTQSEHCPDYIRTAGSQVRKGSLKRIPLGPQRELIVFPRENAAVGDHGYRERLSFAFAPLRCGRQTVATKGS